MPIADERTALVVGATRNLGLAIAAELHRRGWHVIATARGVADGELADLAASAHGGVELESIDITDTDQIAGLRSRLDGRTVDLLFINAGIAHGNVPLPEVSTASFTEVMVTNALSPMRVVEALRDVVAKDGTIGVMSSRQGSISMNVNGGHEVYRASKSALNQLMRSYAARRSDDTRGLLLINPGWVQTELGGPGAPLTVADSAPGVVDVLENHHGERGLKFLDYQDNELPW